MVMTEEMELRGLKEASLMLELAIDCWLCTQDLSLLCVEDVSFAPAGNSGCGTASWRLGVPERGESTKAGSRQGVLVDYPYVVRKLRKWTAKRKPHERLFLYYD